MGGARGEDLDRPGVLVCAEAVDDAAVQSLEILERSLEKAMPETGSLG